MSPVRRLVQTVLSYTSLHSDTKDRCFVSPFVNTWLQVSKSVHQSNNHSLILLHLLCLFPSSNWPEKYTDSFWWCQEQKHPLYGCTQIPLFPLFGKDEMRSNLEYWRAKTVCISIQNKRWDSQFHISGKLRHSRAVSHCVLTQTSCCLISFFLPQALCSLFPTYWS